MTELLVSLAKNIDFLRHLPKLDGFGRLSTLGLPHGEESPLVEMPDFGANPGALRMFAYVPDNLQQPRALVVVLHGCGQTATGYDHGAGWSTLAAQFGFALLMPEQTSTNNANTCFNWFNPDDIARGHGEAESIRQMIVHMVARHKIDPQRIFINGISAGGAMTSVMLSIYPEMFAAGAVIAGLPFGVSGNVREALDQMRAASTLSSSELGDRVRQASSYKGSWPKLSVWHGSADHTVHSRNANDVVRQWLDLHQLPEAPMSRGVVDGAAHQVWWNAAGETVVESYTINGMGHGTPIGRADNDKHYGAQGPFLIEAGISSSYLIAKFFGLTNWIGEPAKAEKPSAKTKKPAQSSTVGAKAAKPSSKPSKAKPAKDAPDNGIDVAGVITRALTAAGLLK